MSALRNRGGAAFERMPGTRADKARQWDVSLGTVNDWIAGRRKPSTRELRVRIFEAGGPEADWWDEPIAPRSEAAATIPAAPPVPGTTAEAVLTEADLLMSDLRTARSSVEAAAGGDAAERIRLLEKCAAIMKVLAAVRGVTLSERAVMSSPAFLRVEEAIMAALRGHPEAARSVAAALEALRGATGA